MGSASAHLRSRARALRLALTQEEELLWSLVRANKVGVRLRRQHLIGSFVVDFYCPAARIAVEIDGDHHDAAQDKLRDAELVLQDNVAVLRFANAEVRGNVFDVLTQIGAAIAGRVRSRGPSSPSPASGEGARG